MATKKKLLEAAAGAAAGAGGLNVEQVFSTYLYQGNGTGNSQNIENGINLGQSNSGGGVFFPDGDGDYLATASLPEFTGAFTFELWFFSYDNDRALYLIDKSDRNTNFSITTNYLTSFNQIFVRVAGTTQNPTSVGFDPDGWNHVAVVRDSSDNLSTFVNGTRVANNSSVSGSITAAPYYIGGNSTGSSASGYEPMYGYMSSVRISDTARYSTSSTSITVPTTNFTSDSNTVLLIGQGDTPLVDESSNSYSITVNGKARASDVGPYTAADAGEGGMVWQKRREIAENHRIFDTETGAGKYLITNSTDAQGTDSGNGTFNANGFGISGNNWNSANASYTSWTWRKAPRFFDCVTYTGNSTTNHVISHNLGVKPAVVIIKQTDGARDWLFFYDVVDGTVDYMKLNDTVAASDGSGNMTLSSTDFTLLGTGNSTNGSGLNYVAYIFAHNDGDGEFGPNGDADIIKCGSYTGNGSASGPSIDLGFEPQWIMIKDTTNANYWMIFDSMRGLPAAVANSAATLKPNGTDAEFDAFGIDLSPDGFQITDSNSIINNTGNTYFYMAIRRGPMAVPESGADVFGIDDRASANNATPAFTSGFEVDFSFTRRRAGTASWELSSRLIQGKRLYTNLTNAQVTDAETQFDYSDGWNAASGANSDILAWMWKRAPHYFDSVAYKGNSTAGREIKHNLGVVPEMIWVKLRDDAGQWSIYNETIGAGYYMHLDNGDGANSGTFMWNNTAPTDTVFTVGNHTSNNDSSYNYVAYLFASVDGVSKVGSYTGTGSALNIDCGFSNGARFIIIKRTDSSPYDWFVWDTTRGISAGTDPRLSLNTTNAEVTTQDDIDPYSSGFTVSSTSAGINTSGGSYIFYAIA